MSSDNDTSPGLRDTVFEMAVGDELLHGDTLTCDGQVACLFLHGAGQSSRLRVRALREHLALRGCGSAAFDFSGHGDSSANSAGSLRKRFEQARSALAYLSPAAELHAQAKPRILVGISMSGEIAIRIAADPANGIDHLVLLVGAVYDRDAFELPFGPAFSAAIRRPQSWCNALAPDLLHDFRGSLTIVRCGADQVIPAQIADWLLSSAAMARSARIIDFPNVDHRLTACSERDPAFRAVLARLIVDPVGQLSADESRMSGA